jgi:hypothetical protein
MHSRTRITLLTALLVLVAAAAGATTAPQDGKYYFTEMKAAIKDVISENQALFNTAADGSVKDESLTPDAFYSRTYDQFLEIAGEDFSVSSLGDDAEQIAQALGTMLQAGRITTAKAQGAINTDSDGGVTLKKFIPAVFGRLVADNYAKRTGVQMKQTTLGKGEYGARNPYNQPDAWEAAALESITAAGWERNKGFGEVVGAEYRLVKPIYIKKACLTCHGDPVGEKGPYGHAKEGYQVGDVRGGISVTIPTGGPGA